jgi:predicted GNAT family N-acyltransferase
MIELQDFFIEGASWNVDQEALAQVRTEVFIIEQQVPEEEEFDQDDPVSDHFLARDLNGHPIGAARLTPNGRIGRMAVLSSWRGKGVGAALLRNAVELARLKSLPEVKLAAQSHAIAFYQRQGFEPFGEEFDDVGIPHRWMKLSIGPAAAGYIERQRRQAQTIDSKQPVLFETRDEYHKHLLAMIAGCRNELIMFTRDLEPQVLGHESVMAAIRELLTHAARPQVRIMLVDPTRVITDGHLLIPLAQRLTSLIQFRRPAKQHQNQLAAFAICDRSHVVFREFGDRWEGTFRPNDRLFARQWADWFGDAWEQGAREKHLERLDI